MSFQGVSQATSENVFESLCATNNAEAIKEDIFNDFGSSSDSDDEKPEVGKNFYLFLIFLKAQTENSEKKESTEKVEDDDELEKIEEKMDTSSPWPDATGETAPVTTTFNGLLLIPENAKKSKSPIFRIPWLQHISCNPPLCNPLMAQWVDMKN